MIQSNRQQRVSDSHPNAYLVLRRYRPGMGVIPIAQCIDADTGEILAELDSRIEMLDLARSWVGKSDPSCVTPAPGSGVERSHGSTCGVSVSDIKSLREDMAEAGLAEPDCNMWSGCN